MTDGFIIENIRNQVISAGLAENEADFCTRWLYQNEGNMHTLRSQNRQPNVDALTACSSTLAFYARAFSDSNHSYLQATARNLQEMQMVCEDALQRVCQPQSVGCSIQ